MQEICDLRIEDVRLDYPASVKILVKAENQGSSHFAGNGAELEKYLTEMHMLAPEKVICRYL